MFILSQKLVGKSSKNLIEAFFFVFDFAKLKKCLQYKITILFQMKFIIVLHSFVFNQITCLIY